MRAFLVSIFVLLLAGVFLIVRNKNSNQNSVLNIALMGTFDHSITPENISTIPLYQINLNLWETLISQDRSNGAGRLTKVDPTQTIFTFTLNEGAKFSNGRLIESSDVVQSIERLLKLEENGHFNGRAVVKKITATGVDEVTIELHKPTPAFLFLLATPEFGIVPKECLDPKSLKIIDLSITSGAYTMVSFDEEKQLIELKKNHFFLRHAKNSPEQVFVKAVTKSISVPEMLQRKEISFAEVYDSHAEAVLEQSKGISGIAKSITKPSLSTFLITNPKAIDSSKARQFLELVDKHLSISIQTEVRSHQFLPEKTFGSLVPSEIPAPEGKELALPDPTVIRMSDVDSPLAKSIASLAPSIGRKLVIVDYKYSGEYHFSGYAQGMNSEFPEIELYLSLLSPYAFLTPTKEEKTLLEQAIYESDNEARKTLIVKIGQALLRNAQIVPITVRSYVHLYDSSVIDASSVTNFDGDIPFYKIRMLE